MSFNKQEVINRCNKMCANTLMETLKIEFIDAGKDFLTAKMPVNSSVHQPMGLLHGGATVALAESVGSAASIMYIDATKEEVRGIEISANHLKSKRAGEVFATAKIIHKGRTIHIWEIRVVDENEELISLCKLMTMVLPLNK
ncbi:MAG: PaaI family thioesterase [Limnohabitans sp.]|nr:PaaI family thioesterase [Limnohabitans sp.]